MTLYVLRHGVAEDATPDGDDHARRLTPRGRARMQAAALGMRRLGITLDTLLTSPLARARETAAIVAGIFDGLELQELDALAAGRAPAEVVRALRPYARHDGVMIVGHEPTLGGVVSLLLTGSSEALRVAFKKGALVALDIQGTPPRGGATLRWMLTSRQLRRLGR